jgi:hypothetical protein
LPVNPHVWSNLAIGGNVPILLAKSVCSLVQFLCWFLKHSPKRLYILYTNIYTILSKFCVPLIVFPGFAGECSLESYSRNP